MSETKILSQVVHDVATIWTVRVLFCLETIPFGWLLLIDVAWVLGLGSPEGRRAQSPFHEISETPIYSLATIVMTE